MRPPEPESLARVRLTAVQPFIRTASRLRRGRLDPKSGPRSGLRGGGYPATWANRPFILPTAYQRAIDIEAVKGSTLPRGRCVEPGEIRAILAACGATPRGARDAAVIAVLFGLGLRRSEVVGVDVEDLDAESWASVLRDLASRGMRAPVLAVGDGALGFWAALRDVWPKTREQRCWVHRIANVLDKLPKRLHGRAKAALHEIMQAETREAAEDAMDVFEREYGAKYPKSVASLRRDQVD